MKFNTFYKFFILLVTSILCSFISYSQDNLKYVSAKIADLESNRKIDNVIVEIYKDGNLENMLSNGF